MAGMYDIFATDPKSEVEGILLDYGTFRVTIARAGGANKRFARELERETKPHQKALQTNSMPDGQADVLLKRVYAKTVVLNWEVKDGDGWKQGIESPEGGLVPFTVDNVLKVFEDLPDLYIDIRDSAQSASLYRRSLREAAAGN